MVEETRRDTQWPAYLVFQQKNDGEPHSHTGSVHAPDGEIALMNARDVFVRRPPCVSLWVAPASRLFARTKQELQAHPDQISASEDKSSGSLEPFAVFKKLSQKGSCTYTGTVDANSAPEALAAAVKQYPTPEALWWWVIPEHAISKTAIEDQEALFEPATRKPFRHQSSFNTLTMMRQIAADPDPLDEEQDEP